MKTGNLIKLLPFLFLGLLISCGGEKKEQQEETEVIKVKTLFVKSDSVPQLNTYTATVKADVINQITPSIPARIEKIFVEIGDRVSKGQVLVQMESTSFSQQNVQLENLKKDYQRYVELYSVGGISQQQVDQLKTQIDAMEVAVNNLEENTRLRSPISGTITARNYDNGDLFGVNPILTVQQLNPLKALINVSESNFKNVKLGMPVDIKLDVYGEDIFEGNVTLIYPTIDPSTHTFGVEVTIKNPDMRVRPGMYARVTLNFGTRNSIIVPDLAVQRQIGANDKYVFVIENNSVAKYRKIELGQRLGDSYEIISGLKDGEQVVSAGQNRLIDGTNVEIIKE